jgi:hypothetical protein
MKTCFKCGTPKDIDDFYRHLGMKDGRLGKCKECCKSDNTANRNEKIEYYREYDRERNDLPHRVEARVEYQKTTEGHQEHVDGATRWIERNPRKRAAHTLLNNAIRAGKIVKMPCEVCGSPRSQGHHENYDEPLVVVWLCAKHHSARHKEMRKLGTKP